MVKIDQAIRNRSRKRNENHIGVSQRLYMFLSSDLPGDYYVPIRYEGDDELDFVRVYNREDY